MHDGTTEVHFQDSSVHEGPAATPKHCSLTQSPVFGELTPGITEADSQVDHRSMRQPSKRRPLSLALLPITSNEAASISSESLVMLSMPTASNNSRSASPQRQTADVRGIESPDPETIFNMSPKLAAACSSSQTPVPTRNPDPERINKFMTALAAKEDRVITLRQQLHALNQELQLAEEDVRRMRLDGRDVLTDLARREMQLEPGDVSTHELERSVLAYTSTSAQATSSSNHHARRRRAQDPIPPVKVINADTETVPKLLGQPGGNKNLSQSPKAGKSKKKSESDCWVPASTLSSMDRTKSDGEGSGLSDEILDYGRKIIGDVGSQFYDLFRDVRIATMGDSEPVPSSSPQQPSGSSPTPQARSNHKTKRVQVFHNILGQLSPDRYSTDYSTDHLTRK